MISRNVIFGVLSIVVGLSVLTIGAKEWLKMSRTKSSGVVATIQAPDQYTRTKSGLLTTYSANFTFETTGGQVISRRRPFPGELVDDFTSGKQVKVFYDPSNPGDFVFEKDGPPWPAVLIGVAFLAAGPVLMRHKAA